MNIHGDIFATLDATGTVLGTTQTGPFGETLSGQTLPVNGATGVSYGYVGQHLKATETQLTIKPIQMGARVYLPNIGRFTSVDPVQGGTPNNYTYVTDPVGDFDLSGQWSLKNFVQKAKDRLKSNAAIFGFSKQNSFSGKPYATPSPKQWDAYYKNEAGLPKNKTDYNKWKDTKKYNEKIQKARNIQDRGGKDDNDKNNPTAPPNIGPNPYLSGNGGSDGASSAIMIGGGIVVGGALWWTLKLASPACGPAVVACAVAL